MNQIPNIEEKIVEEVRKWFVDNVTNYSVPEQEFISHLLADKLRTTLHHQLQKAREESGKRNAVVKEYKDEGVMFILKVENGKTYEASMPIPKWAEIGKLTLRDHSELDQDPVHDFFTAPEEVKRPVYERALAKTQEEQEKKLDQPTVKCGHHQAMLEGAAVGLDQDGKCIDCGAEVLRTDTNKQHMSQPNKDNRPEAVLDRVLEKTGVMSRPKSNEEIINELANEIHSTFASAYAINESVSHEWLKNVIGKALAQKDAEVAKIRMEAEEMLERGGWSNGQEEQIRDLFTPKSKDY